MPRHVDAQTLAALYGDQPFRRSYRLICSRAAFLFPLAALMHAAIFDIDGMLLDLGMLRAHMEIQGPYLEMPGALRYFNTLRSRPDVRVAYATGGCRAAHIPI